MANTFTPEQIAQILEEFFKTVGTRQYIGARYVPIFGRKDEESIEWDNSKPYESLTVVIYQGNSYVSRQYVPAGVDITNEAFWALAFNFNAQVEQYRQDVQAVAQSTEQLQAALPLDSFADETVKGYIDRLIEGEETSMQGIKDAMPFDAFSPTYTILDAIEAGSKGNLWDTPVEFASIGRLPESTGIGNLQGCTLDNEGYIYAFYDDGINSTLRKIELSTLSLVGEFVFPTYGGHGNSINFDTALNAIVCISSNRQITVVSKELQELYSAVYGTTANSLSISSFGLDDDYLMCRFTGTQLFGFYRRLDRNFSAMYGCMPIDVPLKNANLMQDSFLYDRRLFSVIGSTASKKYITCVGVNGIQSERYIVVGIDLEPEGFFTDVNTVYIIDRAGEIFTTPMSNFARTQNAATYVNPALTLAMNQRAAYVNSQVTPSDTVEKYFRTVSSIQLRAPFVVGSFNAFNAAKKVLINANGVMRPGCVGATGQGAYRIRFETDNRTLVIANYTVNAAAGYQYLASITLISKDGTSKRYTFSENVSDEDAQAQIDLMAAEYPGALTELTLFGIPSLSVNYSYNLYI